jgi:hypothetical protein
MDSYENPPDDCQCPQMDAAIDALNKYLFKHIKSKKKTYQIDSKQFKLIYKIPNDGQDHSDELERPTSFFLYLSPTQHQVDYDIEYRIFDKYNLLNSQISAKDKLLFVDAMRFFGGFRSLYQEPQLILYCRREFVL